MSSVFYDVNNDGKSNVFDMIIAKRQSIHGYDFYKMSDDGYSVELENGFVRDVYNTDIPIIIQTNALGSQEITIDEFEEIMISYTGITAFPFDYEKLDKAELEWNAI